MGSSCFFMKVVFTNPSQAFLDQVVGTPTHNEEDPLPNPSSDGLASIRHLLPSYDEGPDLLTLAAAQRLIDEELEAVKARIAGTDASLAEVERMVAEARGKVAELREAQAAGGGSGSSSSTTRVGNSGGGKKRSGGTSSSDGIGGSGGIKRVGSSSVLNMTGGGIMGGSSAKKVKM
mmetsp:Transcript_35786/g.83291  ORF Transcript_35786/g.83291 Transcript_35786/m.83291 type:complete len:176 (+) Transcript_35786:938-1465(+)